MARLYTGVMRRNPVTILCEVKADHEGWEAEVGQMERDVAFVFADLRHLVTRYDFEAWEGMPLRAGYETCSPEVLKRAKKLGWIE